MVTLVTVDPTTVHGQCMRLRPGLQLAHRPHAVHAGWVSGSNKCLRVRRYKPTSCMPHLGRQRCVVFDAEPRGVDGLLGQAEQDDHAEDHRVAAAP